MSLRFLLDHILVFTFQSGYIQIIWTRCLYSVQLHLYIPIWLYSNCEFIPCLCLKFNFTFQSGYIQMYSLVMLTLLASSFTFQSGYIQISLHLKSVRRAVTFTFQSGYIQMARLLIMVEEQRTLHSNLVIFKLRLCL